MQDVKFHVCEELFSQSGRCLSEQSELRQFFADSLSLNCRIHILFNFE